MSQTPTPNAKQALLLLLQHRTTLAGILADVEAILQSPALSQTIKLDAHVVNAAATAKSHLYDAGRSLDKLLTFSEQHPRAETQRKQGNAATGNPPACVV